MCKIRVKSGRNRFDKCIALLGAVIIINIRAFIKQRCLDGNRMEL